MQKEPLFYSKLPVTCHTDFVCDNSTFVAIKGQEKNGEDFVKAALDKGAKEIVIEKDVNLDQEILDLINKNNAKLTKVENTRKALAQLSSKAYGNPAKNLKILGVTGTKGKTTTAYLLEHILKKAGYKTALISSVYNKILDQEFRSTLTTPQPDYLHSFFAECKRQKIDYIVMEVAAQATSLYRTYGIEFEGLIFTNFSLEHSEFYPNQEDYFQAKKDLLFQRKRSGITVLNADDPKVYSLKLEFNRILTFGLKPQADIKATNIESSIENGIQAQIISNTLITHLKAKYILGEFNIYNILAAYTLAFGIGLKPEVIIKSIVDFKSPKGRLESIKLPNGALAFIDYAHNPSSFKSLFKAIKKLSNKIIVVFGAGGGRDVTKRPLMGAIAAKYTDNIILTSDNPRFEDPNQIIDQIKKGIPKEYIDKVFVELDRETAIKKAYSLSNNKDIILLLGKGPDEYQITNGKKSYFSESEILRKL